MQSVCDLLTDVHIKER